jgi:uncharacterized protein (DUF1684 family)
MNFRHAGAIAGALLIAGFGMLLDAAPAKKDTYAQEIKRFHQQRDQSLKNNWATLAGLFWLRPGANSLGTDDRKDAVALPKGTIPAEAGSLEMLNKQVTLKLAPGVRATSGRKPVRGPLKMLPDVSGSPTTVEFAGGRVRMWVVQRGERVGIRVQDMKKAEEYKPGTWYPVDPRWKINAQWVPNTGGRKVIVPNVIGDAMEIPIAGEARFTINGQAVSMVALDDAPGTVEFVFADQTNKTETYHAGRFLDTEKPKSGNTIVLDFNEAYNPPCSVTPYATCPLPPKENRLKVAIPAGQKFSGH